MGAPQYEQAGADIGGSGTTNTIPRWTGASTLGDSGLVDDSTSIYTSTRRVGVDTSTTLANVKLQVGTAASLANYQGAPLGVVLPAGSGSWLELAENSASGTSFRISKDSSTGVVLNTNGKTIGFTAAGYTTAISSSQVVLTTTGNVGIGTTTPATALHVGSNTAGQTTVRINTQGGADKSPILSLFRAGVNEHAIWAGSGTIRLGFAMDPAGYTDAQLLAANKLGLDSTGNVGIGTASPNAILSVYNAGTPTISLWNSSNFTRFSTNTNDCFIDVGLGGTAGAVVFRRSSSATESARIDSSGNVGIGTASPGDRLQIGAPTGIAPFGIIIGENYGAASQRARLAFGDANRGIGLTSGDNVLIHTFNTNSILFGHGSTTSFTERARIDSAGNFILNTATTGATIQAAGSQQGLKLPATPGNGNANTLDSYQEGTRVLSAGDLSGWTYVTATQYWTLVGRTVTLHTVFTGGTSSATGGATIATPPLLTPLRIAAGAAVNSAGTALGNGVCVVTSTSSTTGTVITSNAISSSAVDKVLTVTYETAGL